MPSPVWYQLLLSDEKNQEINAKKCIKKSAWRNEWADLEEEKAKNKRQSKWTTIQL